jgi:hypothetical protein
VGSSLNLVVIVVETGNVYTRELDNLSSRATNTTTNVQDLHVILEVHDVGEVVLVTGDSLFERFAICETAEVEGLTPTILVKVGSQVVVVTSEGSVFSSSSLFRGQYETNCKTRVFLIDAPL